MTAVLHEHSKQGMLLSHFTLQFIMRAGFARSEEDDVELRPDSPTSEVEIEGVNFKDFVAMDDEFATSTEPDPEAIFQSILAEEGMSVKANRAGEAEEESDNETEMVQKLKEENVGRMLAQLECFAAKKMPRDAELGS
ncbi:hypothetical protein TTRE_0000788001 [Trichuris trichiura]|uniref:Uncharacterized protein n=1 Tax=Trichuris trichiura TaxID=36087 RepID=A0A077ZIW0_TRITR|nr:hypothetical protein TTRE_0000788001 [Trichuris trichiura]